MKISVLIPTYKRPHQLREALSSVAIQDLSLVGEVLIGDNSPAEFTQKNLCVIEEFSKLPIIVFAHDPPKGPYPNHWFLAEQSRYEYILFLHDDDRLCRGALSTLTQAVESNPDCTIWFGRNLVMSEDGIVDAARSAAAMSHYGKSGPTATKPLWEWCLTQAVPPDGYLIRRNDYLQVCQGPRDGNVGDWRFYVRLANEGGNGHFTAFDAFEYRAQVESVTASGRGVDAHYMYEAACELIVPPTARSRKSALVQKFAVVACMRYVRDGERRRAWKCFLSRDWAWRQRRSLRGMATIVAMCTPAWTWRWALRHK